MSNAQVIGLSGTQQMVVIPTKISPSIRSSYSTGTNPKTAFRHYFRVGPNPSLAISYQLLFLLALILLLLSTSISCLCLIVIILLHSAWNLFQLSSFLITSSIIFPVVNVVPGYASSFSF